MSTVRSVVRRVGPLTVASFLAVGILLGPARAATGVTELVSVATSGQQGNDISGRFAGPAINATGRVVAFDSIASTLVPGDTNRFADVFVHDRVTATTERVSVNSAGGQANEFSSRPALDGRGRLVAFDSAASNLVLGDNNRALDVFVHDRATDRTRRISLSSGEVGGDAGSHTPTVSAGGRFVAFSSEASNLVPNDTNLTTDIFVRDLRAGTTERISVDSGGQEGNSSSTVGSISPAAAGSRSCRLPATSFPETPTACSTCSSTIVKPGSPSWLA